MSCFVLFLEPDFPIAEFGRLQRVAGATDARSVADWAAALTPDRIMLWQHGATFPADGWAILQRHLEAGGSMLHLGGAPFTVEVIGNSGQRQSQPPGIAMLRGLRLNQCYRSDAGKAELDWSPVLRMGLGGTPPASRTLASDACVYVLEPRLTDGKDYENEDGSPGPREAVVHPLAYVRRPGQDPRFPSAAAAICVDHLGGKWAGGRWVFWLSSATPTDEEFAILTHVAHTRPAQLRMDPTFGCYHDGESPAVRVTVDKPRVKTSERFSISLTLRAPTGAETALPDISLTTPLPATITVPLPDKPLPGLYRITARAAGIPHVTTGYWVMDRELFRSGAALTFDRDTLRRDGAPMPVVGTTHMSSTVHRHFLFEPNAAAWDDSFAEMASQKLNLVRTGIWSAWQRISPDGRTVDEAWLRALEAYYLSARKHGIPVIFTFFAFTPHAFGGDNPYFDPVAISRQCAYVGAVARRFADTREMLWDLINEPSFSSPKQLWKCRPHGDKHEQEAFRAWLQREFGPDYQSTLRARWRLTPAEPIGLPTLDDFDDRAVFEKRRPLRAADYTRFAQQAYADWSARMRDAIRQNGSQAAITTGQDEGGLTTRPSPLYHHPTVEFTSMHTWWSNDALLWDGLLARAAGKPLLISETGMMQRELLSGEAIRSADGFSNLLARKLGYSLAAGAFGVVQWCYDVNPYMASDNEVAIGLRRVDGSYKPEHTVLGDMAAFAARNSTRFDSPRRPDVVLVLPSGDLFSPRDEATRATRRLVRLLCHERGITPVVIPDDRLAADMPEGVKAVILPSHRGLCDSGWQALLKAGRGGATIVCSGWFETDGAGLPRRRLGVERRALHQAEPLLVTGDATSPTVARFAAPTTESWFAAVGDAALRELTIDGAALVHHPLPLDWSESDDPPRAFHAAALARAGVREWPLAQSAWNQGVYLRRIEYAQCLLLIAINESSRDARIDVGGSAPLDVAAGGMNMAVLPTAGGAFIDVLVSPSAPR